MIEFLQILEKFIPYPVALSIVAAFAFGWLIRQLRNYKDNGAVLRDKSFIVFASLLVLLNLLYYSNYIYQVFKIDHKFKEGVYGIYITKLVNDNDSTKGPILRASIKSLIKNVDIEVQVYYSGIERNKLSQDIDLFISKRNISLLVTGTLVNEKDELFLEVMKKGDGSWVALKQQTKLTEPLPLKALVESNIKKLNTNNTSKIEALSNAISSLAFESELLSERLNKIESLISKIETSPIIADQSTIAGKHGKKYSVSIGINKYLNSVQTLNFAANDAKSIDLIFKNNGYDSKLLLDEEATKLNIQKVIVDDLNKKTKKEDMVVLFYSGHGVVKRDTSNGEMGFLIPYDADGKNYYSTCISMTQIQDWFRLIFAENILLIVDSCVAGLAGTQNRYKSIQMLNTSKNKNATKAFTTQRRSYVPPEPVKFDQIESGNRIIMTACKPNQLSIEVSSLKHGLFSYYLIEGLNGEADLNADGKIYVNELYYYLFPKVVQMTEKLSIKQTPQLFQWGSSKLQLLKIKDKGINVSIR